MSSALRFQLLLALAIFSCAPQSQPASSLLAPSADTSTPSALSAADTSDVLPLPPSLSPPPPCHPKYGVLLCQLVSTASLPSTADLVFTITKDPSLPTAIADFFADSLIATLANTTGVTCAIAANYGDMLVVSAVPTLSLATIAAIPFVGSVESSAIFTLSAQPVF